MVSQFYGRDEVPVPAQQNNLYCTGYLNVIIVNSTHIGGFYSKLRNSHHLLLSPKMLTSMHAEDELSYDLVIITH